MSFKFEILENEDKNTLVLSSDKEIYNTRVVFNDDSKSEQFPLVKQLFFLPFVKSITLDKHLILIEKLDFLDWKDVQEEVIDQIEKFLNDGGLIYQVKNPVTIYAESTPNPNVIKFVANKKLVNIAHEFKTSESANYCFIAKALFNHDFIKEIYIDFNFISVTINEKFTSMKSIERHVENASKNQYFEKFAEILGSYGRAISLGGDIYHSIR